MSAFASSSGHAAMKPLSSYVPQPDSCTAANNAQVTYSITSLAPCRNGSGMERPSAFAVLRFLNAVNLRAAGSREPAVVGLNDSPVSYAPPSAMTFVG
jgi:hypothetical protein